MELKTNAEVKFLGGVTSPRTNTASSANSMRFISRSIRAISAGTRWIAPPRSKNGTRRRSRSSTVKVYGLPRGAGG